MLVTFATDWLQPGTRRLRWLAFAFAAAVMLLSFALFHPSTAAAQSSLISFDPVSQIQATAAGWWTTGKQLAQHLFLTLVVLELTVFGFQMALFRDNLGEFIGGTALKVIMVGVFLWFIQQADWIFPAIYNTLDQTGQSLTGSSDASDIGQIVTKVGFGLAAIYTAMGVAHAIVNGLLPFDGSIVEGNAPAFGEAMGGQSVHSTDDMLVQMLGFIIVMALAVTVLQYIIIQAEAAMVMAGGIIFLGFSGSKFTLSFAQGYMGYAINVGAKLLALHLGLAVANNLADTVATAMTLSAGLIGAADVDPTGGAEPLATLALAYVAFESIIMASILWFIPNLAGSFLSGQSTMSGSQMLTNAAQGAMASQAISAGLHGNSHHQGQEKNALAQGGALAGGAAGAGTGGSVGGATGPGGGASLAGGATAPSPATSLAGAEPPSASPPAAAQMTQGTSTNLGSAYTAGLGGASGGGAPAPLVSGAPLSSGAGSGAPISSGGGGAAAAGYSSVGAGGGASAVRPAGISSSGGGGGYAGGGGGGGGYSAQVMADDAALAASGPLAGDGSSLSSAGASDADASPIDDGGWDNGSGFASPMGSGGNLMGGGASDPQISEEIQDRAADNAPAVAAAREDRMAVARGDRIQELEQERRKDMQLAMSGLAQGVPQSGAPASAVQVRLGLPDKL